MQDIWNLARINQDENGGTRKNDAKLTVLAAAM
jgi:hypothetical protein